MICAPNQSLESRILVMTCVRLQPFAKLFLYEPCSTSQVDYERSCATQPVEEAQHFLVCTASHRAQGRVVALVSFTSPPHLALTSYRSFRATDLPSRLALSIKVGRPPRAVLIGSPGAPPDVIFIDVGSPTTILCSPFHVSITRSV